MKDRYPLFLACLLTAGSVVDAAAYRASIHVRPLPTDRAAGTTVTLAVPIQRRLDAELGLADQTLAPKSAQLKTAAGATVPAKVEPLADGTVRLSFGLPQRLAAGTAAEYVLYFDAAPGAGGTPAAKPSTRAAVSSQVGHTFDFAEGDKPVFANPAHATVLEAGANGGFLTATADGQHPAPTIGTLTLPVDGRRYSQVLTRVRREGSTRTGVAANGKALLNPAGRPDLTNDFQVFSADLSSVPDWNRPDAKLTLSFSPALDRPTDADRIVIDWVRLVPRTAVVYMGPITRDGASPDPSAPAVHAAWFRPSTSTAYLYLRTPGDRPLALNKLYIDGVEESAEVWPLDPSRQAHWFDVVPKDASRVYQVRVHLRDVMRTDPVTLTADTSLGRVSETLPAEAAPLSFADITFPRDGSSANLFVSGDATVTKVLLDGADVTADCDLRGAKSHRGTALVTYTPRQPLARGSYHTWEVVTDDGRRALYTIRTNLNDFILGTYGQPNFQLYKDSGLNHYISFGKIPPAKVDDLGKLGMSGSTVPFVGGEVDRKTHEWKPLDVDATTKLLEGLRGNPAVAFYSAPDEPDGADYPLGVGTHGRAVIAMRDLAAKIDPATPSFVQIDNTYRNANYHVYAESMDYSSTHRYNLGQDFLEGDRAAMQELRSSTAPQPYLWVTQLYPIRDKVGERVGYNGRHPLPPEMHVQILESLAGGAKGLIHYIHSGSSGGRGGSGLDKPLWESMVPMHEQVAAVGPVAVRSSPVDWATASDPRVHVQALLCDASNVLLVLTNNAIISTKADVTVPEITAASATVALPDYVKVTEVVEVLPGGKAAKARFEQRGNQLTVQAPAPLGVGTVFWLKGSRQ